MSDETAKIDKVLQEFSDLKPVLAKFLADVEKTIASHENALRRHEECLKEQLAALKRHEENRKIDHENIRQVTEQTNEHYAILKSLDEEVKRRLGYTTEEPPQSVN